VTQERRNLTSGFIAARGRQQRYLLAVNWSFWK